MDYFSVIVLIIIVFVFMSDRKLKELDVIKKENKDIFKQSEKMKEKTRIIKFNTKNAIYDNLKNNIESIADDEYLLFVNEKINLTENDIYMLLANYILEGKRICGINLQYSCDKKEIKSKNKIKNEVKRSKKTWSIKNIYVDIINYLNIFNKHELATYGVFICKKEDAFRVNDEKHFKQNILTYTPQSFTTVILKKENIQKEKLKQMYLDRIKTADKSLVLKILLLIISGSLITTNLIYAIFNVNNIYNLIIAIVIYYCYSYIIRYIYKPIGKNRLFATYIFPIYFLVYIGVSIYESFT